VPVPVPKLAGAAFLVLDLEVEAGRHVLLGHVPGKSKLRQGANLVGHHLVAGGLDSGNYVVNKHAEILPVPDRRSSGVLLSVDEARERIATMVAVLPAEIVQVPEASGRILAAPVVAGRDLPGFDNSSMDGFAIRSGDVAHAGGAGPARLRVIGTSAAGGGFDGEVAPGSAVRIMTGAPIPAGADAVIEVEETSVESEEVLVRRVVGAGRNVRPAGGDLRRGERALERGAHLGPAQLALLAALGISSVECVRRPVVALVPTGDEVVDAGEDPGADQLFDAITPALAAAVAAVGGIPLRVTRARDDIDDVRRALRQAAEADIVLSVGGVSVGDRDLVRPVVEELGELDFWKVAVRPGKPLAVGRVLGKPFVGLPGNPVSALVGFEIFVLPALLAMGGRADWRRPRVTAELSAALETPPGLRTFARAQLEARPGRPPLAHPAQGQGSHQVSWLARSNALLDIPEEIADLAAGAEVVALLVDQPPGPSL
jgi:molybdopterin molybdotransferase